MARSVMHDAEGFAEDNSGELSALLRRQADLRGELVRCRQTLRKLSDEFDRIEAVIRATRPGATAQPLGAATSEMTFVVLEVLSQAKAPLTSRAIAQSTMRRLGLDAGDKSLATRTHRRVCVCLWTQAQKQRVRRAEPLTSPIRWELVNPE